MNIYVGNLHYDVEESQLKQIFEEYGEVASVKIITDKNTGKSKGYAFIDMPNNQQGDQAIEELNGVEVMQRTIVVNKARPKTEDGSDNRKRPQRRQNFQKRTEKQY